MNIAHFHTLEDGTLIVTSDWLRVIPLVVLAAILMQLASFLYKRGPREWSYLVMGVIGIIVLFPIPDILLERIEISQEKFIMTHGPWFLQVKEEHSLEIVNTVEVLKPAVFGGQSSTQIHFQVGEQPEPFKPFVMSSLMYGGRDRIYRHFESLGFQVKFDVRQIKALTTQESSLQTMPSTPAPDDSKSNE